MSNFMCNVLHVRCHMSGVTCEVSCVFFKIDKGVELVGGGSVINGAPSSFQSIGPQGFAAEGLLEENPEGALTLPRSTV